LTCRSFCILDYPALAAGCWLLAAGCWLLAAGCWLLAAGCWLLVAGCWLLAAGCWLLVTRLLLGMAIQFKDVVTNLMG
jgi:hypothetical protein